MAGGPKRSSTILAAWSSSETKVSLLIISDIKLPFAQINYGTGKDVSDETFADAGAPLKLQWYGDSTLTIPLWRRLQ